jgi:hypothetical protein
VSCPINNVAFVGQGRISWLFFQGASEALEHTCLRSNAYALYMDGGRKSLPKRAASFHFMYDNVIDIIP